MPVINSVTDADNGETIGIAPVTTSDSILPSEESRKMFDTVSAIVVAIVLVTLAIGFKRLMM